MTEARWQGLDPAVDHSPLGGSGAPRWIPCPGSVNLSRGIEDPDSEWAAEGTAAHSLAELCLTQNKEPWTFIDACAPQSDVLVTQNMTDAVQAYLDAIHDRWPDRHQGNTWIERSFYCPSLHKYFWGKSDFVYLDIEGRHLHVWDYKHGAGIVVDVKENAQLMYYAVGILEDLGLWAEVEQVTMYICQPRGFHMDGVVRQWSASVDYLDEWQAETLIPAMDRAMVSTETHAGEHCRFCPARSHACPAILEAKDRIKELIEIMDKEKGAAALTNEQVGEFLDLREILKIAGKAAEQTAYARLNSGAEIPSQEYGEWRLGAKRSNREFKKGAEVAAVKLFGKDRAFTKPELKSPAQIDELAGGVEFTRKWAFKPDTGLTVKKGTDQSRKVSKDTKSLFKPVAKKGAKT